MNKKLILVFILILIIFLLNRNIKSELLINLEAINNLTTLYTGNNSSVRLNNLDISGNLNVKGEITGNFTNIQGVRARYIEIGNDNSGILDVKNYARWQISEVVVIDSSGNNIVKGITPTLEIGKIRGERRLETITDGILAIDVSSNEFVTEEQAKIKIDLGKDINIVQINLHNRIDYMNTMNGTYIRLLNSKNEIVKIIYTGVWNNFHSKEFLL